MIVTLLSILVVLLSAFLYFFKLRYPKRNLPSGVREAPIEKGGIILGILANVKKPLCHYLLELGEKHGKLFRVQFGFRQFYIMNDYKTIKKCLKEDGDNFSGRYKGKFFEVAIRSSGIIMLDGEVWSKHRSFMLKVLRDFRLGKSRTNEIVQEECRYLLAEIESLVGKRLDFSEKIPLYTANIISKFIMSKRFERSNKDFQFIGNLVDKITKHHDWLETFIFMFPFIDNSLLLSKLLYLLAPKRTMFEHVYEIFRREINNHSKVLDLNSEGEDLMDRFLIEQSKIVEKTGTVQTFTEFQLIRSSFELYMAGYETTSTTLGWSLLFLSRHQDTQDKMHGEIVDLIGTEQMPSTNDKKSLPFTQAVMDEILRLSTVAPLSVTHRNFKETIIDGILIEKNSISFPNLYACHRDAEVWEKPFEFNPRHFLTEDGEGRLKYSPREELVPFGLGKRQCLGESLARAEIFIFLIAIIQRFKVTFADSVSEEDYQKALLGGDGIIRFSSIKDFIFEKYE